MTELQRAAEAVQKEIKAIKAKPNALIMINDLEKLREKIQQFLELLDLEMKWPLKGDRKI